MGIKVNGLLINDIQTAEQTGDNMISISRMRSAR